MTYTYPDAEYWIQYLEPVEAVYLILFCGIPAARPKDNTLLTSSSVVWPRRDNKGRLKTFELDSDSDSSAQSIDGGELILGFEDIVTADISAEYSGYFTKYVAATHWDPPEGGDAILSDVDTTAITYWGPVDEDLEIVPAMFTGKDFTYKDMLILSDRIVEEMIDASDSEVKLGKLSHEGLPASIIKSIERVTEENKKAIKSKKINKTFGI